jgi:hypothetical protein
MKLLSAFLLLFLLIPIAQAGDERAINEQLKAGGNVTLDSRVYVIDGPIILHSNTVLRGVPGTIIRVSPSSSQFFTGTTGLISCYDPKNIEISGIEIDGNCDELPSWMNSNDQDPHDCERAIFIIGSSGKFGENVYIHDMKIHDTFSDGIHVRCCRNVRISKIEESNCQHEGLYLCLVEDAIVEKINIAGIISDCLRIENSKDILVDTGILFSYMGDRANTAFKGGENGVQIGDQGVSFGVGSDKSGIIHTQNIEIRNITFANGRMSVWLDAAGKDPSDNVYIHDVRTLNGEEIERMGIPVDADFENMPTVEESERVFSSIFDILSMNVNTESYNTEHINTYKNIENVHNNAMKEKIKISPITYLFIGIVGIFILGSLGVLQVII